MRLLIYVFLTIVVLSSCEEATHLDLRQTPSRIVIEGLVTNKEGYQHVRVSRSTAFYASGESPSVDDAVVRVSDDQGRVILFQHNPNDHPDSMGIYLPQAPFTGVVGRTYALRVEVDGDVYEASDKLLSVTFIDSLSYRLNEEEAEDPKDAGKVYEVLMFTKEPQDERNFYLFKFYRNDSLVYYNPTDIYFSDDELLGETIDGIASPVFYAPDDVAQLEIYSLSRNGYIFYNDLFTNLNNDGGGMFGSIPSSPRTNLSNDALGFFQVSAVHTKEVSIE